MLYTHLHVFTALTLTQIIVVVFTVSMAVLADVNIGRARRHDEHVIVTCREN